MNIARWLQDAARRHPDRAALLDEYGRTTARYGDFAARAAAVAREIRHAYSVAPGDRVVLFAGNSTDYLVAMFATWWAGAVTVPVNVKLHERELATIIADCQPALVLTDRSAAATVEAALASVSDGPAVVEVGSVAAGSTSVVSTPEERATEDLAWIFYTSGTTGTPKGAMLTHGNLVAASLSYLADVAGIGETTTYVYAAPMSHGAGLYAPIQVLMGARHLALGNGFDADAVLAVAEREPDVVLFAAPTMVRRLTAAARASGMRARGLGTVVYGGGPMHLHDIAEALELFGDKFVQIYGQGESPMTITVLRREDHAGDRAPERLPTVGRPHSVVDVRVVNESGRPVGVGEVGAIEVRGPTVMAGYWRNPEATSSTIRDGWLSTGDLGSWDAEGFLTLRGRSKEVIITGGSNVYPREVEDVLLQHRDIRQASVVGEPDPEWGESVVAFVVPRPGPSTEVLADELDQLCLSSLARFKRPKRYVFVERLPENAYGKVVKRELAGQLAAAPGADASSSPIGGPRHV